MVVCERELLAHDWIKSCFSLDEIMNFPIEVAILGECPLYILNLHRSCIRFVSNINKLTLQLHRSVSMRPTGPGQIP